VKATWARGQADPVAPAVPAEVGPEAVLARKELENSATELWKRHPVLIESVL
jgi:hypothetical protein